MKTICLAFAFLMCFIIAFVAGYKCCENTNLTEISALKNVINTIQKESIDNMAMFIECSSKLDKLKNSENDEELNEVKNLSEEEIQYISDKVEHIRERVKNRTTK